MTALRTPLVALTTLLVTVTVTVPLPSALAAPLAEPVAGRPTDLPSPAVRPVRPGALVRTFDPPAERWLSGHRGVDLAGEPGQSVRAAAAGKVAYTGWIAGRPVISLDHGPYRTTYEPVTSELEEGAEVAMGAEIGWLIAGHPDCAASACLHWGLKRGEDYLNPMWLLPRTVRLLPAGRGPLRPGFVAARQRAPLPLAA